MQAIDPNSNEVGSNEEDEDEDVTIRSLLAGWDDADYWEPDEKPTWSRRTLSKGRILGLSSGCVGAKQGGEHVTSDEHAVVEDDLSALPTQLHIELFEPKRPVTAI